jgi:hypothetical protein
MEEEMIAVRIIKAFTLSLIAGAVMLLGSGATSEAGSRCTDHCADRYHVQKDACKLIPFKNERKICERRAKEVKDDCKHRCR